MTNQCTDLSLEQIVNTGVKLTPMMAQYYEIKKDYPDILMMFRMGDFYELFFEDARLSAKLLNISLTHRGKLGEHRIPMAGIPHHAASTYIDRITALGKKVAICEQVEDPKDAIGIVKRAVTQIVSPGMPYDLDKSESTNNSFMSSLYQYESSYYLIFIDFTTGEFFGFQLKSIPEVIEKLQIFAPKEFISYLGQWELVAELKTYLQESPILETHLSLEYFDEKLTSLYIERLIPTYKRDEIIKLHPGLLAPIGAISYYICSTQALENLMHIRPFAMINTREDMKITYPTLIGLEIFPKTKELYKSSLLGFLDATKTAMGSRKLKTTLRSPLRCPKQIAKRFDTLEYILAEREKLQEVRKVLFDIRDIERIMAKVATGKVNGSDLINLAHAHHAYKNVSKIFNKIPKEVIAKFTKSEKEQLDKIEALILKTINDEIGATLEKGNLIKMGCSKKRDKLAKLCHNATSAVIELESKYRKLTGIGNLKIKSNNVAGYFIEVSKSHTKKIPQHFVRRQTLVNSERYQTEELLDFEKDVVSAKDKLYKLERSIFSDLVEQIKEISNTILKLSHNIAFTDVLQSLAWISEQEGFMRPEISEQKVLQIKGAWHPLIKSNIKDQFVTHDLLLDEEHYFGLITGPNMAGKTTVMREMAIIQFLAQIGCFVPATKATLSLADYIFSRLGASDDIIKGQSTFMVEMSETAEIIRHASENSLIILDEIGRGTSTYDGLSIAWSLVEYFVAKPKALTLFSTHYHELIELVESLPNAKNLTVKTINENGNVQFLYQLIEEGATQSFGIHVAKLAGLPKEILNRSSQILAQLEDDNEKLQIPTASEDLNQLNLFGKEPQLSFEAIDSPLIEELEKMDIQNMTPLQAIQKLHELKSNFIN